MPGGWTRCLASLEGYVDEILVLDTGSVGDSVDVAEGLITSKQIARR